MTVGQGTGLAVSDDAAMSPQTGSPSLVASLVGRSLVHPVFDYALIGGALSLVVAAVVLMDPSRAEMVSLGALPYFILLSNSAHFAASTVRLYTKPGAIEALPRLTMVMPLAALIILTLCIARATEVGRHVTAVYLTWSPYHYAAQAYGLAVIYCYRSGCPLTSGNKRLLWWVSMVPFLFNFSTASGIGLNWLVGLVDNWTGLHLGSAIYPIRNPQNIAMVRWSVLAVALTAIGLLLASIWRRGGRPMPLISLLVLLSNAIWWFCLPPFGAFIWATIFHGLQYLAIVIHFHLKDQMARPGNRHGALYHVVWFYGASLLLGFGLFNVLPQAYILAGFLPVESVMLVVAGINIHHFVVDAYVWRLKKTDSNRRIVEAVAPVDGPAAVPV